MVTWMRDTRSSICTEVEFSRKRHRHVDMYTSNAWNFSRNFCQGLNRNCVSIYWLLTPQDSFVSCVCLLFSSRRINPLRSWRHRSYILCPNYCLISYLGKFNAFFSIILNLNLKFTSFLYNLQLIFLCFLLSFITFSFFLFNFLLIKRFLWVLCSFLCFYCFSFLFSWFFFLSIFFLSRFYRDLCFYCFSLFSFFCILFCKCFSNKFCAMSLFLIIFLK